MRQMIRISVEVRSGTARFRVGVQAQSTRKALAVVASGHPRGEARILVPIEPEGFFVREPSTSARVFGHEQIREVAA